jgi:hypothetical protein
MATARPPTLGFEVWDRRGCVWLVAQSSSDQKGVLRSPSSSGAGVFGTVGQTRALRAKQQRRNNGRQQAPVVLDGTDPIPASSTRYRQSSIT